MNRRQLLVGGAGTAALGAGAAYLGVRAMGSATDYAEAVRAMRAVLAERPDARDLIRYATLAPNGHNSQPWRFTAGPNQIRLRPDFTRRTSIVDPDDHHVFVSLGCAAETLALAAAARGCGGDLRFDAIDGGAIIFDFRQTPRSGSVLFDAIPKRQSTRSLYDGRAVRRENLATLAAAAAIPGVDLVLITDRSRLARVRDLVVAGNSAQMGDPAFVRELKSWLRFNPRQALRTGDGLYSATVGSPALPEWLGPHAFDLLDSATLENEKYASQLASSAGVAVFVGAQADHAHWTLVGRACQRFALRATALGIKTAFVNQPVEVPELRPELASLVGAPNCRPDIVMRFGHAPDMPFSARRPIELVLAA